MDIEKRIKRYCSTCLNCRKDGYCKFLKRKISNPDEPSCSWWIGEAKKILNNKKLNKAEYMHNWYIKKKNLYS